MLFILMRRNLIARSARRVARRVPAAAQEGSIGPERAGELARIKGRNLTIRRGGRWSPWGDIPRRRFSARVEAAARAAGRLHRLAIRAIVVAALPRCTVTLAAPRAFEVPSAGPSPPSPPLLGVCPPPSSLPLVAALPCRYLAAEHGNGLRRPRLPSGRTLVLGRVRRESRRASPRLPLAYASPRLVSPRLACSRPRRASVSYIALAFVLIISNGAAARERNTSLADARYYARRNSSLSHVYTHIRGYHK